MNDDDWGKKRKRKPAYVKPNWWNKCLDCRAIISDRVTYKYNTCPFCGGANWSEDE
tara:strand:- start:12956 stop:13123 length:168 start_codon:yes stop_codon:yes gene_type:complete